MDWIAALLSVASSLLVGRKYWMGWALGVVASLPWTITAIYHHLWGMALFNVFLGVVCAYNTRLWYMEKHPYTLTTEKK